MSNHRTLLRIEVVGNKYVDVIIPAISTRNFFSVERALIPFDIKEDMRLHAKCNLDAETSDELNLSDFENKYPLPTTMKTPQEAAKKRHKWSGNNVKKNIDGGILSCVKCGCTKEWVKGVVGYFYNDSFYHKAPPCKPQTPAI